MIYLDRSTLAAMDDEHLISSVRAALDPLTATLIEAELLTRFERALDELAEMEKERDEEKDVLNELAARVEDALDKISKLIKD